MPQKFQKNLRETKLSVREWRDICVYGLPKDVSRLSRTTNMGIHQCGEPIKIEKTKKKRTFQRWLGYNIMYTVGIHCSSRENSIVKLKLNRKSGRKLEWNYYGVKGGSKELKETSKRLTGKYVSRRWEWWKALPDVQPWMVTALQICEAKRPEGLCANINFGKGEKRWLTKRASKK